jgi:threonine dehydratase
MVAFGAEVIIHGADFQEALEYCMQVGEQRGLEIVPPFHLDLVAGVSTYAKEFFDAAGELDAVYVPVRMGSGINAMIAIRDLLGLRTEIIGAVSTEAPATALSHAARRPINTVTAHTFVDGVATRSPDPMSLAAMYDGAARFVQVDDVSVAESMRLVYRATHHLPEPAGAIAVAALCSESERERQAGRRVGAILTGCNMDTAMAEIVLSGATPLVAR